jgi:hypothetical protein
MGTKARPWFSSNQLCMDADVIVVAVVCAEEEQEAELS